MNRINMEVHVKFAPARFAGENKVEGNRAPNQLESDMAIQMSLKAALTSRLQQSKGTPGEQQAQPDDVEEER